MAEPRRFPPPFLAATLLASFLFYDLLPFPGVRERAESFFLPLPSSATSLSSSGLRFSFPIGLPLLSRSRKTVSPPIIVIAKLGRWEQNEGRGKKKVNEGKRERLAAVGKGDGKDEVWRCRRESRES